MLHHRQHHKQIKKATTVGLVYMPLLPYGVQISLLAGVFALALINATPSRAQSFSGDGYTSLRTPYVPGESVQDPNTCAPQGAPPPMGDGQVPDPVDPGMTSAPMGPASHIYMPPLPAGDKSEANAIVGPYLTPPTDIPVQDMGPLPGAGGMGYFPPPAVQVDVPPMGGQMMDQAPIQRWQAQTTRDLGYPKTYGSQLHDYGQPLSQTAVFQPVQSQDGPRPTGYGGGFGGGVSNTSTRAPNLVNAWQTQDLHGNRQLFDRRNLNTRPRMTIAPN